MQPVFRGSIVLIVLWAFVVAAGIWARPLMPVDETRYLAVAWEMWHRGDFLVPYLNGEPYSHKPPLLFWGMHLGWAVFGVNDLTPRLVAPLFGLASLFLIVRLGDLIWPDRPEAARTAAIMVLGAVFWCAFTTVTMFDLLHVCFTLLGLCGLVTVARGRTVQGFMVFGAAVGLGVLGKGPAILVHVLPAALLAPLWARSLGYAGRWPVWYGGVALGVAAGAAIGLAWALPAASAGGDAYREAILWGQSADRMVDSFAHGRPFWWYAAVLPLMVLPWIIWPSLWRAVSSEKRALWVDGGVRLCLIWFVAAFVVFSLISGKQPHYLLPEFPALALAAAYAFARAAAKADGLAVKSWDHWPPALVFALIAAGTLGAAFLHLRPSWATSDGDVLAWPALVLAAGIVVVIVTGRKNIVTGLTALSVLAVACLHLSVRPMILESHNFKPLALKMKTWEDEGYRFVTFGKYRGEFHFLGRLTQPVAVVDGPRNLTKFLAGLNGGKAKIFRVEKHVREQLGPDAVLPFRGRDIVVWDAARLPAYLLNR